jgi:hypothetical protein
VLIRRFTDLPTEVALGSANGFLDLNGLWMVNVLVTENMPVKISYKVWTSLYLTCKNELFLNGATLGGYPAERALTSADRPS